MNKARFAITSLLLLLGFGLIAGDCDCDCDEGTTSVAPVVSSLSRDG